MYIMPWHIVFLGGLVAFCVRIEKYLTKVSFLGASLKVQECDRRNAVISFFSNCLQVCCSFMVNLKCKFSVQWIPKNSKWLVSFKRRPACPGHDQMTSRNTSVPESAVRARASLVIEIGSIQHGGLVRTKLLLGYFCCFVLVCEVAWQWFSEDSTK